MSPYPIRWLFRSLLIVCSLSLTAFGQSGDSLSESELQLTTPLGKKLYSLANPPEKLIDNYRAAKRKYESEPANVENIIWFGRRAGYLFRLNEAIEIFSRGIELHPNEPRLYRHRGHRYISTRQFDKAIADLERAAELSKGKPDEIEPDGAPNEQNIRLTTTQGNIWYHLGLAYYLKNDLENARRCFSERVGKQRNDDNIVSTTHWLYMILRMEGRNDEAVELVKPIHPGMTIVENHSYLKSCLLDRKSCFPDTEIPTELQTSDIVTQYRDANAKLYEQGEIGLVYRLSSALHAYEAILRQNAPFSFAYIAAEADYARLALRPEIESGVSLKLAQMRKEAIKDIEYDLSLRLHPTEPIKSQITIRFTVAAGNSIPVVVDFNAPEKNLLGIRLDGENIEAADNYRFINRHLVFKEMGDVSRAAKDERHEIKIDFIAGDRSLNRSDEFLYTLLVPDRASTVFPCFDQPDLKAKFRLQLDLPEGWSASANGAVKSTSSFKAARLGAEATRVSFVQTKPISTYLFAFAAGKFEKVTREIHGRSVTMLHRESDAKKVARNIDRIFEIHEMSLKWLEDYTQIEYPFAKFDFVLIPSFQYGGMEHIGNIFYNADQLFLEETATKQQKLNRASLIAHETAHMWFGNLVTMKWFNDVWLKEVFANFMAAKIVHPGFPEINHDLGFMLKHHPSAYGEDRTRGTYPIQQKLDNLKNAGTVYGRIIYMKAPIVMRQLETMMGQSELRDGLREYLTQFSYDNAVWDDLIEILDRRTDVDLKKWSQTWVKEPGTPELESRLADRPAKTKVFTIKQTRKSPSDSYWPQQVDVKVVSKGKVVFEKRTMIEGESIQIELPDSVNEYDFFLANGSELGYGYFRLDEKSRTFLLSEIENISDDVTRGAAWLALYETMVRGEIKAEVLAETLIRGLSKETEPLNRQNLLSQLDAVFWKFLNSKSRSQIAAKVEAKLWDWIDNRTENQNDAKSSYYKTLVSIASTEPTVKRLYEVWESQSDLNGLKLSEADFVSLAYALALRIPAKSDLILETQLKRLENEDRRKRFEFVTPALSPDLAVRDAFFESLKDADNRRPERWALDGVTYLHHPLRAKQSEKYLLPSLELLEEIQVTGDIFFPKRWLVATLSGHRSASAAETVRKFLEDRPDYSPQLTNKILQAADLLFKVAKQN